MHGMFSEADIDKFYVRLDKKLVAIEAHDAHIAEYDKVLSLLGLSGVPLTGFPACRRFLLTLSQFPASAPHVASYVQAFPDFTPTGPSRASPPTSECICLRCRPAPVPTPSRA
jgi:hypothetical protein